MTLAIGPSIVTFPGLYNLGDISGSPVTGNVSSPFGPRDPIWTPAGWTRSTHDGTDINGPGVGGRPVIPGVDCEVTAEGASLGGLGNVVFALAETGHQLVHAHLQPGAHAGKGNFIPRGNPIGQVGTTGASTGDHLHFGIIMPGLPIITDVNVWLPPNIWLDPMQFLVADVAQPAPEPVLAGSPPGPGQMALMTTIRTAAVADAVAQLKADPTAEERSIYMLIDGAWKQYIIGAPPQVNAMFPDPIPAGVGVLVVAA